ncbi:DUF1127 domain-containing protein [Endozoicomonas sp. SM1973]|uniref:DUF1127 domain-containing protein n=1 Tax=Spartinivicinus marinus TaxID=2994442 RepID=A0A853I4X4_9GAMM|nr:DUF1127 domain-containing protein [Spartinivicinus marinus]MCX4026813.1 DUF1127 domain-containing protein [Spartinivicinus marinus]NYZ64647.1 DUF1127 domain-containing protein [Spartinivicinus marinus]
MKVRAFFRHLPDHLGCWQHRLRTRKQLLQLDMHELQDLGISKQQAVVEGSKPFWRH